jgi:hypothetical protein
MHDGGIASPGELDINFPAFEIFRAAILCTNVSHPLNKLQPFGYCFIHFGKNIVLLFGSEPLRATIRPMT